VKTPTTPGAERAFAVSMPRIPRVGVRRAQKAGVRLSRQHHVVRVLPRAGKEARVFLALDGLSDQRRVHFALLIAVAPACTAFTIL
jgi:hypothetical protein